MHATVLPACVALVLALPLPACGGYLSREDLLPLALAGDQWAIDLLRADGKEAITFLSAAFDADAADGDVDLTAWDRVFDGVGAARHNRHARLWWHTELAAAEAEAKASGKPILSLRLLGDLRQDLTCANSRFFRVVLYPDPQVAELLRERFVLHWSSERAVPVLTIDFGDGRTMRTTITGNSAHYVLDAEGQVLDALPGLYHPSLFRARLVAVADQAAATGTLDHPARLAAWRAWHRVAAAGLAAELQAAEGLAGIAGEALLAWEKPGGNPWEDAGALALGKSAIELPILRAAAGARRDDAEIAAWMVLADRLVPEATISAASAALMIEQGVTPAATAAFLADLRTDTARNEWRLHTTLHGWLAADPLPGFDACNRTVYADLFLSPAEDPWMGLDPEARFAALPTGILLSPEP